MKITFDRNLPGFWTLYFILHFCFLMALLVCVRLIWSHIRTDYVFDLAEAAFESLIYAVCITVFKVIRYRISKKQYEKNPVDRRKNRRFRE